MNQLKSEESAQAIFEQGLRNLQEVLPGHLREYFEPDQFHPLTNGTTSPATDLETIAKGQVPLDAANSSGDVPDFQVAGMEAPVELAIGTGIRKQPLPRRVNAELTDWLIQLATQEDA